MELAKRLGVNHNTIARWLAEGLYQRYENWVLTKNYDALPIPVREAKIDVSEEFFTGSPEMQDRLRRIIEMTGDPKLEAELCQDWLDRAGFAPQRKVAASGIRALVLTPEAMEVFFRRMAEAGLTPVSQHTAIEAEAVEA
jgi:hypothetical protein